VQEVLFDVLRHRILLSFEAEASGVTPDQVLEAIRQRVPSA
jgi:MoxR-like ATPase